jgi:hypothetical protein
LIVGKELSQNETALFFVHQTRLVILLSLGKLLQSFITVLDLSTPDESGGYARICPTDNFDGLTLFSLIF